MLSWCVINRRQNRELEKHQEKKKTTSVDEKEKDEVKLHAALVLNITFWAIYEPRREKITLHRSKIKKKLRLNVTETQI